MGICIFMLDLNVHVVILLTRRYASTGTSCGLVSVCQKLMFSRNGWMDQAGFGM